MSLHQRLSFHALSLPQSPPRFIHLLVPASPGWA
jgi:hypothetical protein